MRIQKTRVSSVILSLCTLVLLLSSSVVKAAPYASCITNNNGTLTFYLNEGGGSVVITYEDGSTNANYNGVTTGTNQAIGAHTFSLAGHTSYTIAVTKTGAGVPSVITSTARTSARGDDVNKNPTSPYFGRLYSLQSAANGGIWIQNSDLSNVKSAVQNGGITWTATSIPSGASPFHVSVAPDDSVIVADFSTNSSAVWKLNPDCTTSQLVLGPKGLPQGNAAGVHGTEESRAIVTGSLATGDLKLMIVDGDYSGAPFNSILTYNIGSGPLPWQKAPDAIGYEVGLNITGSSLNNIFPGLTQGPNGYIYASNQRQNMAIPNLVVLDSTGSSVLWSSADNLGFHDWFVNAAPNGGIPQGLVDSAVSPNGKYLVGLHLDNHLTIVSLVDGIPDVSTLYIIPPTSFTANGRGICWDAANNLYLTSSGLGAIQSWTLGFTSTAITTGNASGPTGFQLLTPSTTASVVATVPQASQGGSNGTVGTPAQGQFTITRNEANGDYTQPLTVNFTLSGTATNGVYTCSPTNVIAGTTGSVVIPAGETSVIVYIIPTTANVPRPTTTVTMQITGGSAYSAAAPTSDSISIVNTSSQQLDIVSGGAPSMYKAYSNDFGSFIVQRKGDLNAASFTPTFTFTGTAVAGTDFTLPANVTFDPGVVQVTGTISPLVNGQPPVHTNNSVYTGNRTATIKLATSGNYTAGTGSSTITIVDDAKPSSTVLLSNPLTDPNDASNWKITYGNGDNANFSNDFEVMFGYDLTGATPLNDGQNHPIPLPPSGATTALRLTCNKDQIPGVAGAVNVYYTNRAFSGDFAVRFNMNLIEGANPSIATEGVLFGINHTGSQSNWYYGSGPIVGGPWASDGIWYYVTSDPGGSGAGDYLEFTGNGGSLPNTGWKQLASVPVNTLKNVFKIPQVFTAKEGSNGGVPANGTPYPNGLADASTWSDVEIKQVKNVVTLSINKSPIFTYTNTTTFTNGYLMLGYSDPYGSDGGAVGTIDAAAYFSDLKVVSLAGPSVGNVTRNGGNVTINFTSLDADDTTTSFALQTASAVNGPYTDVTSATITQLANGSFQATTTSASAVQFYRIRHK